jgi:hypothetical protein
MVTGARSGITERELSALRFVAEQYAVPMALLAELVDVGPEPLSPASAPRVARRVAERLERLGYADRRPMLGQTWVIPSRRGLAAAGLPYGSQTPAPILLGHVERAARLRLHLEDAYPDATWESERAIRHRWAGSGARVRIADGGLCWSDGTATGVELEVHLKQLDRYVGVVCDVDPAWSAGVWWFTPAAHVELLTRRLADAGNDGRHQVVPSPAGVVA